MVKILNKKNSFSILIILLIGLGLAIFFSYKNFMPITPYVHNDNVADFNDDRQLVGAVHNVFVGRVISQEGTKSLGSIPETQFKVEVIQNIKGELSGIIKVNQQGGYKDKQLILVEKDKLIEPGKTYLFATRYLESEDWHTLVPLYGDIPIKTKEHETEVVEKFKKAYKEEIPLK